MGIIIAKSVLATLDILTIGILFISAKSAKETEVAFKVAWIFALLIIWNIGMMWI